MGLKLYYNDTSPPVRSTLLTINALNIEKDVELITVDMFAGEHLKPEYLKKNPLHTIPTLEDGDFIIYDSHAINAYLVDKYGKDDSLYPKDLQKRAIVNQRLHFDNGVISNKLSKLVRPLFSPETNALVKDSVDGVLEVYNSLEAFIGNNKFIAGNQLTIADFSVGSTISTAFVLVPAELNKHPKLTAWLRRLQALPYYKRSNQEGLDKLTQFIKSKLGA